MRFAGRMQRDVCHDLVRARVRSHDAAARRDPKQLPLRRVRNGTGSRMQPTRAGSAPDQTGGRRGPVAVLRFAPSAIELSLLAPRIFPLVIPRVPRERRSRWSFALRKGATGPVAMVFNR